MSLFRFVRASSLLYLAGRYRERLYLIAVLLIMAGATAWLYSDVALFLREHYPQYEGLALVVKTLFVYGALGYCLWLLRPRQGSTRNAAEAPAEQPPALDAHNSRLEQLAARDRLQSRYDAILAKPSTEKIESIQETDTPDGSSKE